MAEWKVAPSYQQYAKILSVDEATRKAKISVTCDRCGGSGTVYSLQDNGMCYKCFGAGSYTKVVKAYTEEEYARYIQSQERSRKKKEEAEKARIQDLLNNSKANRIEALEKFGYDPADPKVYIVMGGNTYDIKDQLKEQGARFDKALGWYASHELAVPAGYQLITFSIDELYDWNAVSKRFQLKAAAEDLVKEAIEKNTPESLSEYMGEVKERLRDLDAVVLSIVHFSRYYGDSSIYTFKSGENVLVWMTSSSKDLEKGDHVLLTGTVKSHDIYKGVKQTKLTRCSVKYID